MKKGEFENLANEYVASLFPTAIMARAFISGFKKSLGKSLSNFIEKFENHNIAYFTKSSSWENCHNLLVKKIQDEPEYLNKIYHQIISLSRKLVNYTKELAKNLEKQTDKNLWQIYSKYVTLNEKVYSYGLLIPLLDFHNKTFLSDVVKEILNKKAKSGLVLNYFSILTTPTKKTFNKKQELDLLRILETILKDKIVKNLFLKLSSQDIYAQLKKVSPKIFKQIKNHTKKYAWVYYVYEGPASDEIFYIDSLKDLIRRRINPKKEIKKYFREIKELSKKQIKIIKNLKLNKKEKKMVYLAKEAVFIKALRRDRQSQSYYYMQPILEEIAQRLNLTLRQVRMMLPEEVEKGLKSKRVDIDLINQRIEFCIYGSVGGKEILLVGKKAREFFRKNVKEEKTPTKVERLEGTIACPGKIKGKVKIVNAPEDIAKIELGDILVSSATNPNLMPAIRKAAAIVTDEGGLTCHAAIVSRELGIPCVIGTKIATRVLKNGDMIEVDATAGVVKILRKKH